MTKELEKIIDQHGVYAYVVISLDNFTLLFSGTYEACMAWIEANPPLPGHAQWIKPLDHDPWE
jgi:hypothetical protein